MMVKEIKIPKKFKVYFWDVGFEKLDPSINSYLIIKRVLDRGKTSDIKWLFSQYGEEKIKEVLTSTRDLSRITANFWSKILNIPRTQIPCLKKRYSPIRFGLSS